MALEDFIYFEQNNFHLFHGDSFKVLKLLKENSIDFIFADPPYFLSSGGISCKSGKQVNVNKGEWDLVKDINEKLTFHRKWIKLCRNILKENGTIMISSTLHSVYTIGVALELEGFSIINNIIWRKMNPAPNLACRCFTHSTETIIWARKVLPNGKKGKHCFNYDEMKKENNGKQMKDFWDIDDDNVIELSTSSKKEKIYGSHPTQKPIKLMTRIIRAATKVGDTILDPFNGSGSTGIAAFLLDRNYIGIEKDIDYLELTKRRLLGVENEKKKF